MILNVNKPLNWTSFEVVRKLKFDLGPKKIGHAGTLDPLASGVLIVLTDGDTKKQSEIMALPKEYTFEMALGLNSATYDLEGPFTVTPNLDFDVENLMYPKRKELQREIMAKVDKVAKNYVGQIEQKVPLYSAVKVNGKRLYKQARFLDKNRELNVNTINTPIRKVEIYDLKILNLFYKEILIMGKRLVFPVVEVKVSCGKGTYIRSLAYDIGKDLGMGATVVKLIRNRVGLYLLENSMNLETN